MLLTRSPLSACTSTGFTFDLHVLGTPPAFILSQDQTLRIILSDTSPASVRSTVEPITLAFSCHSSVVKVLSVSSTNKNRHPFLLRCRRRRVNHLGLRTTYVDQRLLSVVNRTSYKYLVDEFDFITEATFSVSHSLHFVKPLLSLFSCDRLVARQQGTY